MPGFKKDLKKEYVQSTMRGTKIKFDDNLWGKFKKKYFYDKDGKLIKKVKRWDTYEGLPLIIKNIFNGYYKDRNSDYFKGKKLICRVYSNEATNKIYSEPFCESVLYCNMEGCDILRGDVDSNVLNMIDKNVTQDKVCREILLFSNGSYHEEGALTSFVYNFNRLEAGKYKISARIGGKPEIATVSKNKWTIVFHIVDMKNVISEITKELKGIGYDQIKEMMNMKEKENTFEYKDECEEVASMFD